jgi:hypothetical protein
MAMIITQPKAMVRNSAARCVPDTTSGTKRSMKLQKAYIATDTAAE